MGKKRQPSTRSLLKLKGKRTKKGEKKMSQKLEAIGESGGVENGQPVMIWEFLEVKMEIGLRRPGASMRLRRG